MIRLIVTTYDAGMAANVGGAVESWSEVIEIDNPQLEAALKKDSYQSKIISVEKKS